MYCYLLLAICDRVPSSSQLATQAALQKRPSSTPYRPYYPTLRRLLLNEEPCHDNEKLRNFNRHGACSETRLFHDFFAAPTYPGLATFLGRACQRHTIYICGLRLKLYQRRNCSLLTLMPEKSSKKKQRTAVMAEESEAQKSGPKASGQSQKPKLKLEGSCHCQAIKFCLMSSTPCPYTVCFCGFCRKLTGGSGGATFITGDASTFQAEGTEHLGIYRVMIWRRYASRALPVDRGCQHWMQAGLFFHL